MGQIATAEPVRDCNACSCGDVLGNALPPETVEAAATTVSSGPFSPGWHLADVDTEENDDNDGIEPGPSDGFMQWTVPARSVTIDVTESHSDSVQSIHRRPKISHTLTEARRNVLDVDMDLLRGISLSRTLRGGGRLWRCVPHQLEAEKRMKFYEQSVPTKGIDIFFSHSWKTAGRWKALSLFLQGNWLTVVIAWSAAVCAALCLCVFDMLPMPFIYAPEAASFAEPCPLGCWMLAFGMVASLLTPLACAYLPDWLHFSPLCFVDVACIHQADASLMERGIYGIGGILSVSKELRVLWSEPYLSRLWCVFELAAFRKANPDGKITLSPLFVEGAVACIWILFTVTNSIHLLLVALPCHRIHLSSHSHSHDQGLPVNIIADLLLPALPVQAAAHFLRGHYVAKQKLLSELENFDLSSVQCSNDFDREFIYEAISVWYGSVASFTAFVQDDLRKELVTPILSTSMPLAYYLLLVTPSLSVNLEVFLALWKGGAPSDVMISHALASLLGYCLCWCPAYLALLIFLCDRFATPCSSKCMDHLQSFAIGITVLIVFDAGYIAARYCFEQGLSYSMIWAGFALVAVALAGCKARLC